MSAANEYVLKSASEAERLYLQARVWEAEAEVLLDRIGVPPEGSGVDLGCGAMGILGPLARRMRTVVGVERDADMISAAEAYVRNEGLANVQLKKSNALAVELPQATFDIVHERFVMPYVSRVCCCNE